VAKKYRTFIKVESIGEDSSLARIVARSRILADEDYVHPDRPIRLDEDDCKKAIEMGLEKHACLYDFSTGKVVHKPVITLNVKKPTAMADGEDSIIIKLEGVPDDYGFVRVLVGDVDVQMDPNEELEIAHDTPEWVWVKVEEPLLHCEPVHVIFRSEVLDEN
jgi:hypothetical protein